MSGRRRVDQTLVDRAPAPGTGSPSSAPKRRLDQALVDRGLVVTRSRARALIMAGEVRVDGHVARKPGVAVAAQTSLEVTVPPAYVSRGGDKLAAALQVAEITLRGRTCLDIGAAAGGFTDCLLQHGAGHVIAVDVGYNQLDFRMRQDPRVSVRERVNARYLGADDLAPRHGPPGLLVMDLAFISVTKVLPAVTPLCDGAADAFILVKPQFECGPEQVGAGGIVSSAAVRRQALETVGSAAAALGWSARRATPSPIRGRKGNWECFLQLRRAASAAALAALGPVLDSVAIPDDGDSQ